MATFTPVVSEPLLILFGTLIAFCANFILHYMNSRQRQKHSASILLHDLLSIEYYLHRDENDLLGDRVANLRYTENWQRLVAECSFLKERQVQVLYKVYDNVYEYNHLFPIETAADPDLKNWLYKGNRPLAKLKRTIADDEWGALIDCLKRKSGAVE